MRLIDKDTIYRQGAVEALKNAEPLVRDFGYYKVIETIRLLPSAEPKRPSEIQDILNYLDTVLHPIISPEHWNVYSELHDMISKLPSTKPRKNGKWVGADSQCGIGCPFCGTPVDDFCSSIDYIDLSYEPNFCPNCGADMTWCEEE